MRTLDGLNLIVLILIFSFAIDRIVMAFLFLMSYTPAFTDPALEKEPAKRAAKEKNYKLLYFVCTGFLAILALVAFPQVRLLEALGKARGSALDTLLTGIVYMGGADRISSLLKTSGEIKVPGAESRPIKVEGKLTFEDTTATIKNPGK